MTEQQEMELTIEELAPGAKGVGRAPDGRAVLTTGALAGEKVRARVSREHRRYLEAETVEVLAASPQRIAAACPVYGQCGGCDLMHLEHPAQIEAKVAWLAAALERISPPRVRPLASPGAWGWRNRVRQHVDQGKAGFRARASHELVALSLCPIAAGGVNRLLRGLAKEDLSPWQGLAELEVVADHELALVRPWWGGGAKPRETGELAALLERAGADAVALPGQAGPPEMIYYQAGDLELTTSPGLFCQANWRVNQQLVELVLEAAGEGGEQRALDLFAGSGNFSLPLGGAGWRVMGVEGSDPAVRLGNRLARDHGLEDWVELVASPVGRSLKGLARDGQSCGLVVLDPPRPGAKGLMPLIAGLEPDKVVYVSCHAAALARDAAVLCGLGYQPVDLSLVDMFPQTSHLEAVLVLQKS